MALAGFSSGEAEGLRRAMSRKRSEEAMQSHRERFVEGAVARGVEREVAERVFSQIHGFSGFGFPKSHAAAFGLLAYQSTWLRVHYGPEFLCALLNEQPMGFYPPDALVHEAQRRGIEVLGPDVNRSDVLCRVEPTTVRATARGWPCGSGSGTSRGWRTRTPRWSSPSGSGAAPTGSSVSWPRDRGPAGTGSSGSPGPAPAGSSPGRRNPPAGTIAGGCRSGGSGSPAARSAGPRASSSSLPLAVPTAPALRRADALGAGHGRLRRLRDLARPPPAVPAARRPGSPHGHLRGARAGPDGSELVVAGLLVARQRPATAKGVMFLLIEDETGVANVIVTPPVYERHRLTVRTASLITIAGRLERREGVINVVAASVRQIERPDAPLAEVRTIEPSPGAGDRQGQLSDLDAVLPIAHSFGRRGRLMQFLLHEHVYVRGRSYLPPQ